MARAKKMVLSIFPISNRDTYSYGEWGLRFDESLDEASHEAENEKVELPKDEKSRPQNLEQ